MALARDLLALLAIAWLCLAFACLGYRILRLLKFRFERPAEHLLVAIALGVLGTELLLFLVQLSQQIRAGSLVILVLLCIPLVSESRAVLLELRGLLHRHYSLGRWGKYLVCLLGVVLASEFLASMAPLSGSDAMQYHFTTQKLVLEQGFHPLFSNSHSFLCGQHHYLILFGLALGSEKVALGLIFLGGVLTAAVLACLAARWVSSQWVLAISLLFLLTPVVFWQMSSSGSPDIYQPFLVGAALIVLFQKTDVAIRGQAFLAGILMGGVAGAKYIGCFIALAVMLAVAMEFRSVAATSIFALGSLLGGFSPYLRNTIWTGDPVFPFLAAKLSPHLVTPSGLVDMAGATGADSSHSPAGLIPFLFFAGIRSDSVGFWDFFGPTVLVLAPLVFLALRNAREWRVAFLVWFFANFCIYFGSGLARFLLPLFPIALFSVAGGIKYALDKRWRIAHVVAVGTMTFMILAGAAGLAVYIQKPVLAAVGFTSPDQYLTGRALDYQVSQTINQMLAPPSKQGRVLLFLRHQYYLRIPYLTGDPDISFEVDTQRLNSPEQWEQFLKAKGITYIARTPDYPAPIAAQLTELERRGRLVPFARREVGNLEGMRIRNVHVTVPVVILRVNF